MQVIEKNVLREILAGNIRDNVNSTPGELADHLMDIVWPFFMRLNFEIEMLENESVTVNGNDTIASVISSK